MFSVDLLNATKKSRKPELKPGLSPSWTGFEKLDENDLRQNRFADVFDDVIEDMLARGIKGDEVDLFWSIIHL